MSQTKAQLIDLGTAVASSTPVNGPYVPASNTVAISTNSTERLRVDSSGRLLVGTSTSALETVVIKGDGGGLQINRNQTGNPTVDQSLGSIGFKGIVSANSNAAAEVLIKAAADENHSGSTAGSRLEFHTKPSGIGPGSSPTERMRIQSSGAVLVNSTALLDLTGQSFQVNGFSMFHQTSSGSTASVFTHTGSGTQTVCLFRQGSGPSLTVGSITVSGGSSTAYNTSSDYRLKENIAPVSDGITRLQQLKPSRFNFIVDPAKTVDGFIAHEVQAVVPEAITGEKDAVDDDGNPVYQGIDQSKLVPLLTAALQEAIGEIESLKARVAALESV